MRLGTIKAGMFVASALACPGTVLAADLYGDEIVPAITEPGGFEARWEFATAAYLWMPGINGSVGVGGLGPVDVDMSFADIFENLDAAVMLVGSARYDRFGIFSDFIYTRLSTEATGPLGIVRAEFTNELIVGTLMGEYRVIEAQNSSLDVMAGARVWGVTGDLDVTVGPIGPISVSREEFWVDPMIGVKGRLQGASPWYLTGWAMAGGFGVSSDFAWDAFGGLGYEITDRFSLIAGYRGLGVDYADDGFVFDIIQHGPVLGGVFKF